jgi:hypothetical protein
VPSVHWRPDWPDPARLATRTTRSQQLRSLRKSSVALRLDVVDLRLTGYRGAFHVYGHEPSAFAALPEWALTYRVAV